MLRLRKYSTVAHIDTVYASTGSEWSALAVTRIAGKKEMRRLGGLGTMRVRNDGTCSSLMSLHVLEC